MNVDSITVEGKKNVSILRRRLRMVTNRIAGKDLNYKSYLDAHALEIEE